MTRRASLPLTPAHTLGTGQLCDLGQDPASPWYFSVESMAGYLPPGLAGGLHEVMHDVPSTCAGTAPFSATSILSGFLWRSADLGKAHCYRVKYLCLRGFLFSKLIFE